MNIFISHSSQDFSIAEKVCGFLEGNGHKCFLAPRDIRSGYEYAEEIMNGIESSELMVLLLSEKANKSPHVLREVERAVSKCIPIIVYKLEEVKLTKSMEYFLMSHQWVNGTAGVSLQEILSCVAEFASKKNPQAVEVPQSEQSQTEKSKKTYKGIGLLLVLAAAVLAVSLFVFLKMQGADEAEENKPENKAEEPQILHDVEAGDTLVLGSYLDEPIEWRVLSVSEDGKSAVVVSKNILTMKAFDAAEGGRYNYLNDESYWGEELAPEDAELLKLLRGDNTWENSNIRTWLNAEKENVSYNGQVPAQTSMSEYKNGYDMEPGFLSYFTKEERETILTTEVNTNGITTRDKVFLLSSQELVWFEEANVSMPAIPTQAALEQDDSDWYDVNVTAYGVEDYCWWLRDSNPEGPACEAYLVGSSYSGCKVQSEIVGLEGYGIRPAMTIDLSSECIKVK